MEKPQRDNQQQALEPMLQEDVPFYNHTITAVRLEDGRLAVVLRWVCEVLKLDPQGQVQRIERTSAIAGELLRVKVQPRQTGSRGGGKQIMPAVTLRGFPTWILGINPNEVRDDPKHPEEAERIRQMIIAYQVEAVDVLYNYFANKSRPALPEPRAAIVQPIEEPLNNASHEEKATYHETMSLWHRWQADYHMQQWRRDIQEKQGILVEEDKAMNTLVSNIQERLGPPRITEKQQNRIQHYVSQVHEVTGKHQQTIFAALKTRFRVPRYDEIPLSEWPNVVNWFKRQLPVTQQELFDQPNEESEE